MPTYEVWPCPEDEVGQAPARQGQESRRLRVCEKPFKRGSDFIWSRETGEVGHDHCFNPAAVAKLRKLRIGGQITEVPGGLPGLGKRH